MIQKAGDVLGKGASGCVIHPPITCKTKKKNNNSHKKSKKVSKIVRILDKSNNRYKTKTSMLVNEINISSIIKENAKSFNYKPYDYFCLMHDFCKIPLSSIPKDDFEKCNLSSKYEYISLNLEKCGQDLTHISSLQPLKTITNLKKNIKHLLNGLKILKLNKIIHCDIKPQNLTINDNLIKFIDFDASLYFPNFVRDTKNNKCNMNEFISRLAYTPGFLPPEVSYYLQRFKTNDWNELYEAIAIDMGLKEYTDDFFVFIDYLNTIPNLDELLLCDKSLHIFKFDIFSLGNTLKLITEVLEINDPELNDLISNMTNINFLLRFDIEQCLNHAFMK